MIEKIKLLTKCKNTLFVRMRTALGHLIRREEKIDRDIESTIIMLKRLQSELEADHGNFLLRTEVLSDKDFAIIGKMIQIYSSSDFNARRTINAIRKASLGAQYQTAGMLQDKQLYESLKETARSLPCGNTREGLIKAAETIAMHHQRRHDFAHWIFRKVPDEPVYYFCSNDERKLADRSGVAIRPGETRYGLMPIPEILTEMRKLAGHCEYLAHSAVRLETGHDELKAYYAEKQAEARRAKYEAAKARTDKRGV
jgi:hypothetical protein